MHCDHPLVMEAEAALADGRWDDCRELSQRIIEVAPGIEERALARCLLAFNADRSGAEVDAVIEELYECAAREVAVAFGPRSAVLRRLELQRALFLSTRDLARSLMFATRWLPEQLAELGPRERASWARNLVAFTWEAGQFEETVRLAEVVLGGVDLSDGARRFILAAKGGALLRLGLPEQARHALSQAPPPHGGFASRILEELDSVGRNTE